ncbi:MAG: hypothetical protein WAN03_09510 [Candidatus Sulfotelmatobacter sp.]
MISYAAQLRQELSARNAAFAGARRLPHVLSYGEQPVIVYEPSPSLREHGNFLKGTYRAILQRPEWKCRLDKIHSHGARSLPRAERRWRELDSCMSSDALLMNIFCHPKALAESRLGALLGSEIGGTPEFGFKARVPLRSGRVDRTEVDMKLGDLLVESKLTETDFQMREVAVVESYRDLHEVFAVEALHTVEGYYCSYQLIRNVLAAHARSLAFCVLLDARRPDLLEAWYGVMKCVRVSELRTRCKVLTWQEISGGVAPDLQRFLDLKYGIVPAGCTPSGLMAREA